MADLKVGKEEEMPVWGNFSKTDLLKTIYREKNLEEMSDKEVEQMLEDLI